MITYETEHLLDGISRIEQRLHAIESTGYNNAAAIEEVATNTAPVIGWGMALITGIVINVAIFPLAKQAEIPYIATGIAKFEEIQAILAQEIGITYANIQDFTNTGEGQGVHPQLMKVYRRANELAQQQGFTITIRDGMRTVAEQAQNVRNGASKTMNSRHIRAKNGWGHALDLEVKYDAPQSNERDWEGVNKIKPLMLQAATEAGVNIEWGGDWSSFKDGFHWQLSWGEYPADKAFANPKSATTPVLTERNVSALLTELKRTESSGGNYSIESKANCMLGAYQFAASTLTELGYIKRQNYDTASKAVHEGKGEQHCAFLANADNWESRGGKHTFLTSSATQDQAARDNIKLNLAHGAKAGAIDPSSSQQAIAGYAKAAWFGHTRATALVLDGDDRIDGNGIKTSKYAAEGASIAANVANGTGSIHTIINRIQEVLWKTPSPTISPSS